MGCSPTHNQPRSECAFSLSLQALEHSLDIAAVQVAFLQELLHACALAGCPLPGEVAQALGDLSEAAVQLLAEHVLPLQNQEDGNQQGQQCSPLPPNGADAEGAGDMSYQAFLAAAVLPKVAGLQTTASTSLLQCLLYCGGFSWHMDCAFGLCMYC